MQKDEKRNTENGVIYRNCYGETVLLRGHITYVLETKEERLMSEAGKQVGWDGEWRMTVRQMNIYARL